MNRRSGHSRPRFPRRLGAGAALALGLVAGAARADDLPILPAPLSGLGSLPFPGNWLLPNYKATVAPNSWSGFYVHPLIGYQTAQFTGGGGRLLTNANGFTLGGEGGYNFQFGQFVFGPVADVSYSFMQGHANTWLANVSKVDIGWFGSARALAGFTFDRFMIYGTGGFAFAETEVDGPFASNSQTQPGWTAGGGVQYLWSPNAILHVEYRRTELENKNFSALPFYQRQVGVTMNLINAGFTWKF
jgi:outer membrane immunogenic protein